MERKFARSGIVVTACLSLMLVQACSRQDVTYNSNEFKIAGIWTDPDGCQHWVMDDGLEGYMTPNVLPNGKPVCGVRETCAIVSSDQLFATDRAEISGPARSKLLAFFANSRADAFKITGHTDSRASDAYNMDLSERRAQAVASIATGGGFVVAEATGRGESEPKASNSTSAGMAENRRVEIECVYQ